MKSYAVNEIFYSLQGEGMRTGTANVFVRFAGCNLACDVGNEEPNQQFSCDTEFVSSVKNTGQEILDAALALVPVDISRHGRWLPGAFKQTVGVIFTGGEPSLQLDYDLVQLFRQAGFYAAIETNGTADVAELHLDWITCSPKVAEHAVKCLKADEVKYVRGHGQGIPKPRCEAPNKLLSPAFAGDRMDRDAVNWCCKLVKENPEWRLSLQTHKWIGVR